MSHTKEDTVEAEYAMILEFLEGKKLQHIPLKSNNILDYKFRESWDALMPVVEKIEKKASVTITCKYCSIQVDNWEGRLFEGEGDTTIKAVYSAVLSYIHGHE